MVVTTYCPPASVTTFDSGATTPRAGWPLQLACYQYLHAGGLDVVNMHKNIEAAAIGRDKAKRCQRSERLQFPALSHHRDHGDH
jgi:hypothetical protein